MQKLHHLMSKTIENQKEDILRFLRNKATAGR